MIEGLDYPVPVTAAVHSGVTIALAPAQARFSLRTRTPEHLPGKILTSAAFGSGHALCLGPDEWLVLWPAGADAPVISESHAAIDISHRNIGLKIEGPKAVALLLTGCALDLERDFPVGKATRTLYETVEIVLWRTGPTRFQVEVWRSFATYLWDALALAAGDLGSHAVRITREAPPARP